MPANCIFCKIIKGDIPSIKIAETDKSFAFMDIGPLSEGHCLVIPKEHAEKYHQLSEDSCADVARVINRVAKASGVENYNLLQNNGSIAKQAVFHVHFHIIPKNSKQDGLVLAWNPAQEFSKESITARGAEIKAKYDALVAEQKQ